ncbi:zf-HC2 domain-containing protein [Deinococcus aquatilis]|jgi:hypothetical protein|uniref:zf-HC2 domain-containing protein n=1 Tax=Deinococcus aquatilis TaxID=519440 RepID=UPI0003694FA2|nr:zf-HC2 domain-containing protein [Deinococcus aquatilis]
MTGPDINQPSCEACREDLSAVLLGLASAAETEQVRAHLQTCADCQREAAELRRVLNGLEHAPPEIAPPAELRARVLNSARQQRSSSDLLSSQIPSRKRRPVALWLPASLGLAAAVAALLLWPQPAPVRADVVVSAGDSVVFASSHSPSAPLVIRSAGGQLRRVSLTTAQPAWFTEAVYAQGRAYLLDAANNQLVVLNVAQGQIERRLPTPGGAAGLAVEEGRVFVKTASSGELLVFGRGDAATTRRSLARAAPMPEADYMDAVLHAGNRLLATSHTTGQVFALSADGGQLLDTYAVGGAPVGLEEWSGGVLVLDVQGRLLELTEDGQIGRTLSVGGHPDKFSVMNGRAYLTDRGGTVSVVDLSSFRVTQQRTFGTPMDIAALPDGHLALADATRGLLMLMPDLSDV